jgi:hypothetical protein
MKANKLNISWIFTLSFMLFVVGFILGFVIGMQTTINTLTKFISMANVKVDKVEFSINETKMAEIAYEIAETNGYLKNLSEVHNG